MTDIEKKPHLFIFGPGYTAQTIARRALREGWEVSGTARDKAKADLLQNIGINPVSLDTAALSTALESASHWLISIAPTESGDPALEILRGCSRQDDLSPTWIGYLSSTNIYGNHDGGWVDETTPTNPGLERGQRRVLAEAAWQEWAIGHNTPLHIFRLAGIYGPGRNAVRSLLDNKARRIIKPGQNFSRIHVEDIAETVWRAMNSGLPSMIFNIADDDPCPPQDVITEAAGLMGIDPPPEIPIDQADMSPMARSFYMESKLVRNSRIKDILGVALRYPSFRDALPEFVKYEKK